MNGSVKKIKIRKKIPLKVKEKVSQKKQLIKKIKVKEIDTKNTVSPEPEHLIQTQKLKLKKKILYDSYVLTNKHIICKFKYLMLCFDDDLGLVNLKKSRLDELLFEQNINISSSQTNSFLYKVMENLKDWHPQISKVNVNYKHIEIIDGLDDYPCQFRKFLKDLPRNNCIKSEDDMKVFQKLRHNVVDVVVSFQLIKKISDVNDYQVNFNYLHKLLVEHIFKWNAEEEAFLDETSVTPDQIPYSEDTSGYAYPYIQLIPLNL